MAPDTARAGEAEAFEAGAFRAANAPAYLSAVFAAYRAGQVVLALPKAMAAADVPLARVVAERRFDDAPGWFDERFEPILSDAPAQVAFSSGTTGTPKALLLSHRALADVTARINAAMGVSEEIREYIGVPVTFSFGFGRARAVAAAGGRSYLPPHGFDPGEIARMLDAGEINAVSAVPTLWRIALANPDAIGRAGERVRWIEIGSQYMAAEEKAAMKRLFPNARIVQHYGLTEASRSTLLDISGTEGAALESVGRATGAVEIAIGAGGAIRIRGPHLASGRLTEAGLVPVADADGWLTTADRGRIEDGLLYYEGRLDELINVGGVKIDPSAFEQRLAERLGAPGAVAVGRLPDPLRGERVLVAIPEASGLEERRVAEAAAAVAAEQGLAGAGAIATRRVAEIPLTATGKVRRSALAGLPALPPAAASFAAGAAAAAADGEAAALATHVVPEGGAAGQGAAAARAEALRAVWAAALGAREVPLDRSFYDLGGDSLSALTVILRMEAIGIDPATARGVFDGRTIAELTGLPADASPPAGETPAAEAGQGPRLTLAEAANAIHATRGVLALWVVVVHWLPGVLNRLPGTPVWIYEAIEPLLRFGTPGFALVFGMGVGMLGIPQYLSNPAQFRAGAWLKFRLIFAGVLVMALFAAGVRWTSGRWDEPLLLSALFYSAISYYALAMLALPGIVWLVTRCPSILVGIVAAMAGSLAIHEVLSNTIAPYRLDGPLELGKILLTAKYGFFRMSVYVLLGMGVGHLYRVHHARPGLPGLLALTGGAIVLLGLLVAFEAQPGAMFRDVGKVLPWHLMIYAGVAVLILAGFARLVRGGGAGQPRWLHLGVAVAIATGILALPIFIGHEIVLPAKALLANVGVPEALAIALPMAVFLAALALGYRRLLRFLWR